MIFPITLIALGALASTVDPFDAGANPILAKHPTVNATTIAFEFAGDIWQVPRAGGIATRLTASVAGSASAPYFSPDGKQIAFTAQYDGNVDAYVMPATGGTPTRLTAHPNGDSVVGWTPDSKCVLVRSTMLSNTDYARLFEVPVRGGTPKPLPFPAGEQGAFSPDGAKLAYVPNSKWERAWKRYRGGQTTPIWVGTLSDSHITVIPRKNTNDFNPMWVGESIYYLSDPTGPVGLNRFDTVTREESVVIPGKGFDIKSATAGYGAIAYERLGSINLFDIKTGRDSKIPITLDGDFAQTRTGWRNLQTTVTSVLPSPSGQRVVVCARGWCFTVPAKKGDTRLLADEQGIDRTQAAWSPDGKSIVYFSDSLRGQCAVIRDMATGKERSLVLGEAPGEYDNLTWSPDSSLLAYTDNKLNLWILTAATGVNKKVDTGTYRSSTNMVAHWSPDSKWLTYAHDHRNFMNGIMVYNVEAGKSTEITRSLANASHPSFDRSGKYLYFLATTDEGFAIDTEDIIGTGVQNITTQVYAVLLKNDTPNPFLPESDEEKASVTLKVDAKPDNKTPKEMLGIELEDIQHRVVAIPVPKANYSDVVSGPEGTIFLLSNRTRGSVTDDSGPGSFSKYAFADRKLTSFGDDVRSATPSADGTKLLIHQGAGWRLIGVDAPPSGTDGQIDLSGLSAKIDPVQEWEAIYHQVWRKEKILFYDPGLHGINAAVMEKRYEPFVKNIRTRADLNYLFEDMLGEICIGHMFIGGGDHPAAPSVKGGLLGADYEFVNGRYRITRVYDGESWNPDLYSPLGNAGVRAQRGEYILAINGRDLTQTNDIYLALENTAGKRVSVKLGPNPDGSHSREVAVTPVESEQDLRNQAWQEDNRRYVERETGGKCGYLFVPDTGAGGWQAFMRYYYAQHDKDAIIIDERFNHGGAINDFMVNEMDKPLDFFGATRYGQLFKTPNAAVYGPKVMLVNEMAGSGGDIFPYLFKAHKTGKLVGHRTWGGELTAAGFQVMDGGSVRAPEDAQFDPITGQYVIDNVGVAPDIEVEFEPAAWRAGIDSQLKAAVDEIKREMHAHPPVKMVRPKYPDKSKLPGF